MRSRSESYQRGLFTPTPQEYVQEELPMPARTTPAADLAQLKEVATLIYEILGNGGWLRRPLVDEYDALRRRTGQTYDAACRTFRPWTPDE